MKFKKIDLGRQANFILAVILIHFLFFGYICNLIPIKTLEVALEISLNNPPKYIGENILYLNRILFNPYSFLSIIILFLIVFLMVFRENFFEYGLRNSLWLTPFIIIESWIWYFFINGFDLLDAIGHIGQFFISFEGYLTIFSLLFINFISAILGAIAKEKYKNYLKKQKEISYREISYNTKI